LTNSEIIAQSVLFLGAGYDTIATTLSFISYNLATNPEVQERLIKEIDSILEKHVKKIENSNQYFHTFIS
jgi:cytochrome P450